MKKPYEPIVVSGIISQATMKNPYMKQSTNWMSSRVAVDLGGNIRPGDTVGFTYCAAPIEITQR